MPRRVTCPHCGKTFELPRPRRVNLSGFMGRSTRLPKEYTCTSCHKKIKDDEVKR